jgi:hypothetical protein
MMDHAERARDCGGGDPMTRSEQARADAPWFSPDGHVARCRQFIRRVRPQGVTILCGRPTTLEIWTVGPAGEHVYHGGACDVRHAEAASRGYRHAEKDGWRIEFRAVSGLRGDR